MNKTIWNAGVVCMLFVSAAVAKEPATMPGVTEVDPVRVNKLEFQLVGRTEWAIPAGKKETSVTLLLKVTNQSDEAVTLNLNDTIELRLKDADGKEVPIDIKRLRTSACPPLVVDKGKSGTVQRTAILEAEPEKPGEFRLVGSDGMSGRWTFNGLKPGKYTLDMTYDSDRASFKEKDATYWVGKATTKELAIVIPDPGAKK